MVEPVLSVLFPIMCAGSEEDEDEEEIDDAECRMPSMYAPQVRHLIRVTVSWNFILNMYM